LCHRPSPPVRPPRCQHFSTLQQFSAVSGGGPCCHPNTCSRHCFFQLAPFFFFRLICIKFFSRRDHFFRAGPTDQEPSPSFPGCPLANVIFYCLRMVGMAGSQLTSPQTASHTTWPLGGPYHYLDGYTEGSLPFLRAVFSAVYPTSILIEGVSNGGR